MNELKIFDNAEFGEIRTVVIDGEPWFVGKDVAVALGYTNSRKALGDHVDEEDKGVTKCDTLGGVQEMAIINESGLYSLILSSKLDSAKRFKHWVTSEVLPEIRRTGRYFVPGRSAYDVKATSVGEVVNLLRIVHKSMKERLCRPDDIAVTLNDLCGEFGIPMPVTFLAAPRQVTASSDMTDDDLREYAAQLMEMAYRTSRGLAVTNEEFAGFCGRNGIESLPYKKWLLQNGYIAQAPDGKSTITIRISGKARRCVVFRKSVAASG